MALINKQQILDRRLQLKTEIVQIPEWGGEVILMELTGKQRDNFEASIVQMGVNGSRNMNLQNLRARLACKCIMEPDDFEIVESGDNFNEGNKFIVTSRHAVLKHGRTPRRMFSDAESNDLGDLGAATLQVLFDKVQKLSGMSDADVNELATQLKNDQIDAFGSS